VEAKLVSKGGNPNVLIADPEIKSFRIKPVYDFIIIACDGVYDKLSSKDVIKKVWNSSRSKKLKNIHEALGKSVENILIESMVKKSHDNITAVIIGFENMIKKLFPAPRNSIKTENYKKKVIEKSS
jgi:protein phosphatase 2C family protein 2/3